MQIETTRSRWWFLLPIFMNIVGGVIAYFVLRHDDPSKAKNCLLLGAAMLAIPLALAFIPSGFEATPVTPLD